MSAFVGELELAEEQTLDAVSHGLEHGVPEDGVMSFAGGILYAIRRAQGRVGELVSALQDRVVEQPGAPVWRVALAGALSESGRADEAVEHVEFLTANDCHVVGPAR